MSLSLKFDDKPSSLHIILHDICLVQDDDEYFTAPPPPPAASSQTTMVLRKRIRRIRQGMKKYNTQLVEVKRELKSCKAKMDTQNKQVCSRLQMGSISLSLP